MNISKKRYNFQEYNIKISFHIKLLVAFFFFISCSRIPVLKIDITDEQSTRKNASRAAFDLTQIYYQVTTHSEMDAYPAISPDGQWIAFASRRSGNMDIWLKPVKGGSAVQLTTHRADDMMPCWSPDGGHIVFVSQREDAAGDLWRISLKRIGNEYSVVGKPIRLTSYLGADITPAISPDGKFIAFTSDRDGKQNIFLYRLSNRKIFKITNEGGSQPTWSPDGKSIAFVSFDNSSKHGQILAAELSFDAPTPHFNKIYEITTDQTNNAFPYWNPAKNEIFFSRYDMDTNQDGRITPDDRPTLWKTIFATAEFDAASNQSSFTKVIENQKAGLTKINPQVGFHFQEIQLMPNLYYDYFPVCSKDSILYFISRRSGNDDIWSIHVDGVIPRQESGFLQYQFAVNYFPLPESDLVFSSTTESTLPEELVYRLLAFQRVIDFFPAENDWVGWSLYEIGRTYLALNQLTIAKAYFHEILDQNLKLPELHGKIELQLFHLDFVAPNKILDEQIAHLERIQNQFLNFHEIAAEALLVIGEVYYLAKNYTRSIESLEQLIKNYPAQQDKCAKAQLLIGDIYSKFGQIEEVVESYLRVVNNYPLQEAWVDSSMNRILSLGKSADFHLTISNYRNFIARYKNYPRLAARIQRKIGENYFQKQDYNTAIEELSLVANNYPDQREEIAQAELRLAEIFSQKGEDIRAIRQYKKVINDFGDVFGGLFVVQAKEKLLTLYLETGRRFLVEGEIRAANLRYRDAIEIFTRNIDAHRGFVATMYALHQIDQAIQIYQNLKSSHPDDEVVLYILGLCYSYKATEVYEREQKIEYLDVAFMKKSNELILQSLERNYRLIQAYLTLSYNYEALEKYESALLARKPNFMVSLIKTAVAPVKSLIYWITLHKERPPEHWFEQAIDALTTAIALNDENQNPTLESELALNLAGNFYNLGEFGFERAYHYYEIKLENDSTFTTKKLAADVYKRMGHCALVVEDFKKGPDYLKRAIHIYNDLGDKENWLLNIKRLALLYQMAGDYDLSIDYFKMAIKPDEDAKRYNQLLFNYRNIAYNYQLLNDYEEATKFAKRALDLLQKGKVDEVKTRPNWIKIGILGIEFPIWNIGQIGAGASTASEGFTTDEEVALLYTIIGNAAFEQRSIPRAIDYTNKKIEIYQKRKDRIAEAIFLNNIGYKYYLDVNYQAAWDYFEKSLKICKKEEHAPGMLMNILNLASLSVIVNKLELIPGDQSFDYLKQIQSPNYLAAGIEHIHFGLSLYSDELFGHLREKAQLYNLLGNLYYLKNLNLPDSLQNNEFFKIQQQLNRFDDLAIADSCYQNGLKIAAENNFIIEQIAILQNIGHLSSDLADFDNALDQLLKSRNLAIERNLLSLLWRIDLKIGQILIGNNNLINNPASQRDANFYLNEAIAVVEQNALQLQIFRVTPFYLYQVRNLYQTAIDYLVAQDKFIQALRLSEQYRGKQYLDMIGSHKLEFKKERHKLLIGDARSLAQDINNLENKIRLAKEQNRKMDAEIQSWIDEKKKLQHDYNQSIEKLKKEDPELETFIIVEPVTFTQVQEILDKSSVVINYFVADQHIYIWSITADSIGFVSVAVEIKTLEQNINSFIAEVYANQISNRTSQWLGQTLFEPIADRIEPNRKIIIIPDQTLSKIPFSYLINFVFRVSNGKKLSVMASSLSNYYFSYQKRKIRGSKVLWASTDSTAKIEGFGYDIDKLITTNIQPDFALNLFKQRLQSQDIIYLDVKFDTENNDPLISAITPLSSRPLPSFQMKDLYSMDLQSSLIVINGVMENSAPPYYVLEKVLLYTGTPSMIFSLWHPSDNKFWDHFFDMLLDYSVAEAFSRAQLEMQEAGYAPLSYAGYQLIGFEGMNDTQEEQFANEQFESQVKMAMSYYNDGAWADAMMNYEQALVMAKKQGDVEAIQNLNQLIVQSAERGGFYDNAIKYQLQIVASVAESNDVPGLINGYFRLIDFNIKNRNYEQAVNYQLEFIKLTQKYGLNEETAGAYRTLGMIYSEMGDYDTALNNYSQAIQTFEELNNSLGAAYCLKDRGKLYLLKLDNYSNAIEDQEQALRIFSEQNDIENTIEILHNLGFSHENLANYQMALKLQLEAYNLAQQFNNPYWIALSQQHLANVSWKIGSYEQALRYQKQALQIFEQLGDVKLESVGLATQGLIFMSLGNLEDAISNEQQALELAQKINSRQDMATIHINLGLIYRVREELDVALEHFQQAMQICASIDYKRGMGYSDLNVGSIYLQQGKLELAFKHLRDALNISQEIMDGRNEVKCLFQIGNAHYSQRKLDVALDTLAIAAEKSAKLFIPEVEWRCYRLIGQIHFDNKNLTESLSAFDRALSVIEYMRAQIKVEEYKAGFIDDKLDVYYDLVDLYLQLQQPDKALEIVERAKSRNFIDLLANRDIQFSGKVDEQLLNQGKALQNDISKVQSEISGLIVKGTNITVPEQQKLNNLNEQLQNLKQQYEDFLIQVKAENSELAQMITVEPLNIDSFKIVLPDSVLLMEYFYDTNKLFCWAVTNKQIVAREQKIQSVEFIAQVQEFRSAIQEQRPVVSISQNLYNLLIEPFATEILSYNHIVIIPHGVFHYLPFAALMDNNGKYLIEKFSLSLIPSAMVLKICMDKGQSYIANKNWTAEILALGNPDLNNPQLELPFAEKEIESVQLTYPRVTAYLNAQATETIFKNSCESPNMILLSCHGEFDAVNPLFSSLLLTPDSKNDGRLEAYEIFGLKMNNYLVAMSACETGLGKINVGDEVIGLSRSFIYAGSSSLLSSLWKVDDLATAVMIKRFFRYLKEGDSRARALQKAINLVRAQINVHPAYWAAFNITGDFR